jgi:hypothetical protein
MQVLCCCLTCVTDDVAIVFLKEPIKLHQYYKYNYLGERLSLLCPQPGAAMTLGILACLQAVPAGTWDAIIMHAEMRSPT